MDKNYIIETKNLTKQYGSQKSVADLNIHVQKGRKNLRTAWKKRSRKNDHYENATWIDKANFRRS